MVLCNMTIYLEMKFVGDEITQMIMRGKGEGTFKVTRFLTV